MQRRSLLAAAALTVAACAATAQSDKPRRILVSFPPGGSASGYQAD